MAGRGVCVCAACGGGLRINHRRAERRRRSVERSGGVVPRERESAGRRGAGPDARQRRGRVPRAGDGPLPGRRHPLGRASQRGRGDLEAGGGVVRPPLARRRGGIGVRARGTPSELALRRTTAGAGGARSARPRRWRCLRGRGARGPALRGPRGTRRLDVRPRHLGRREWCAERSPGPLARWFDRPERPAQRARRVGLPGRARPLPVAGVRGHAAFALPDRRESLALPLGGV